MHGWLSKYLTLAPNDNGIYSCQLNNEKSVTPLYFTEMWGTIMASVGRKEGTEPFAKPQVDSNFNQKLAETKLAAEQDLSESGEYGFVEILAEQLRDYQAQCWQPIYNQGVEKIEPLKDTVLRTRDFKPGPGLGDSNIVGLRNLGATCYLNSILQCLYRTTRFTKYFLEGKHLDMKASMTHQTRPTAHRQIY